MGRGRTGIGLQKTQQLTICFIEAVFHVLPWILGIEDPRCAPASVWIFRRNQASIRRFYPLVFVGHYRCLVFLHAYHARYIRRAKADGACPWLGHRPPMVAGCRNNCNQLIKNLGTERTDWLPCLPARQMQIFSMHPISPLKHGPRA
jgi:hypothetical protein